MDKVNELDCFTRRALHTGPRFAGWREQEERRANGPHSPHCDRVDDDDDDGDDGHE